MSAALLPTFQNRLLPAIRGLLWLWPVNPSELSPNQKLAVAALPALPSLDSQVTPQRMLLTNSG